MSIRTSHQIDATSLLPGTMLVIPHMHDDISDVWPMGGPELIILTRQLPKNDDDVCYTGYDYAEGAMFRVTVFADEIRVWINNGTISDVIEPI